MPKIGESRVGGNEGKKVGRKADGGGASVQRRLYVSVICRGWML